MTLLALPTLDARKVNANNILDQLKEEIRRRTREALPQSVMLPVVCYGLFYGVLVTRLYLCEESLQALIN